MYSNVFNEVSYYITRHAVDVVEMMYVVGMIQVFQSKQDEWLWRVAMSIIMVESIS
jgi:hypothetical protein